MEARTHAPQPNKAQAAAFLNFLDPQATKFTFQAFDDNPERKAWLARVLHGSIDEHWDSLTALSQAGAGVFVTINETNLKGRKASDIIRVRALFADLDGAPLSRLWNVPLALGWINRTSHSRYQGLWRVDGIAKAEFTPLQKAIVALTGSDPKVVDPPRVMRLPGFHHLKREPHLVVGLPVDGNAVNGRDAVMATPPPPKAPTPPCRPLARPGRAFHGGGNASRRYALAALESEACAVETARVGERNHALNRAAFCVGTLVANGNISAAEIEDVLTVAAQRAGLHPKETAETLKSGLTAGMASPRRIGASR